MTPSINPLLAMSPLPPYDAVEPAHVAPAIDALIDQCHAALELATSPHTPADFHAVAAIMDPPLEALGEAWGTVNHLLAVANTPELRAAHAAAQPRVTELYTRLSSDLRLFDLYQRIQADAHQSLTAPEQKALSNALMGFRLGGAELEAAGKARFAELQMRASELSTDFANRLQDATDAFAYWATPEELEGVPADVLAGMKHAAELDGRSDGVFKVTLQQPHLMPVLQFANNRALREQMHRAHATRASEFGPAAQDNTPLIPELLRLRQALSGMLNYASFADVSLVTKMADSPEKVQTFLRDIADRSRAHATKDLEELRAYARSALGLDELQAWDLAYASEKLRQARYAFSAQDVKQYFQLAKVLPALLEIAERLFGVTFTQEEPSTWHPSVVVYRIEREAGVLGRFYLDPYARAGKRGGAWMDGARARWAKPDGQLREALAYLVTNFAPPAAERPGLMSHDDVVTLFHEFGHGLHFLLSTIDVPGVAGIGGVEWDAVELPSQLMENFAWEWDIVQRISSHVDSGAPLPRTLFDSMLRARTFQSGLQLLRQVELALFDMRLHAEPLSHERVQGLLDEVRKEVAVMPAPAYNRFQNGFAHVFAGGYAAGYYSYLWAEVLAADVWDVFVQSGPLNRETGERYRSAILERGGSRDMNENFLEFVGRPPRVDAFLRLHGIDQAA